MSNKNEGAAVLSYGAKLMVKDPLSGIKLDVGGLTDFNGPQTSRGEIDVTTLSSTAKEYNLDLKDLGTFTSTMQTRYGDPAQKILLANMDSSELLEFDLVLPDDGYGNGPVTITFDGRVQSFPVQGSMGQVITTSLSIRITGDVRFSFSDNGKSSLKYSTLSLNESSANDGSITSIISVAISGDSFAGDDNAKITAVSFSGTPEGLTPQVQKVNSKSAVISFSGKAKNHDKDSSEKITFSFLDAAFVSGKAKDIQGATKRQLTINFA